MGQAISNAGTSSVGGGGALGENMGDDGSSFLSQLFGGGGGSGGQATDIPGQSIGSNYGTAANSAAQGGNFGNTLSSFFSGLGNNSASTLSPMAGLLQSGLNAYQQYARQNAASNYANQIQQIYSPTGPYAQQMQSNIARQYAAQGRNAEVGPQQVQLAALLANGQAQALGGAQYANAAQNTSGANMLNGLFTTPGAMTGLGQVAGSAWNGLSNLFSGF
jgi:hypothetical protein